MPRLLAVRKPPLHMRQAATVELTAKQRRRAAKKERRDSGEARGVLARVRPDWEYTMLLELRCDRCGQEQTRHWVPGCVVCGHPYATFERFLEPDPRDVPWIESAHGPLIVRWWR